MKEVAVAIIFALVGLLLVGIQQQRVVALRGEVAFEASEKKKAVDANTESQATITTLRAEALRNARRGWPWHRHGARNHHQVGAGQ